MTKQRFRYLVQGAPGWILPLVLAALSLFVACSRDTPAATTQAQINLEPGVYEVEHPELFRLAKEFRAARVVSADA